MPTPRLSPTLPISLGLFSLAALAFFYHASLDIAQNLSPQGCRMSWMSPSYHLQHKFDLTWTPLARRYGLWLYREEGWEKTDEHNRGVPVLFIPGNAGSSRQVRSIASSAARQYYASPGNPRRELVERGVRPLDLFTVEFNEDLSAFHGPTIDAQIAYTSSAISYILSLYPPNTTITIMGHSMGGIVATSLLPSKHIAAIITMSTPHTLPPARFDHRVDRIYDRAQGVLDADPTPILSLCGGATDMMIPSESCILPTPLARAGEPPFRRTVFSSALEGAWTGVGHREMVWCHQVRWRVARAALELSAVASSERGVVLDKWLRDGHSLPPAEAGHVDLGLTLTDPATYEVLPANTHLVLKKPQGSRAYLLPLPLSDQTAPSTVPGLAKLVLYVSQGSIPPVSPQNMVSLQVSVFSCMSSPSSSEDKFIACTFKKPTAHRLMPNPVPGHPFPVPNEGSDESEGVVLFEADIPMFESEETRWVAVRVEGASGAGWVVGGFEKSEPVKNDAGFIDLLFGGVRTVLPDTGALRTSITFPRLMSNALVVYRVVPQAVSGESTCSDPLLPPLLKHTSHSYETHYFPWTVMPSRRILLHTHSPAPYVSWDAVPSGLSFTIYSSGSAGCGVKGFTLQIDWTATAGRWASRYFTTLASWAIGVVALILFDSWSSSHPNVPTVSRSLSAFSRRTLPRLLLGAVLLSFVPLPPKYYLGIQGQPLLSAVISPLLLLIATGLVSVTWWVLLILMWPLGKLGGLIFGRSREEIKRVQRSTVVSMFLIFLLIFLFIPWQVAFMACWAIQLYTCASLTQYRTPLDSSPPAIPLLSQHPDGPGGLARREDESSYRSLDSNYNHKANNHNHNMHVLLLMTWLLPLVAPVLVVWVRTLAMAGLTSPFDGDHFFSNVAPFLILVDFASWTSGPLFEKQRFERFLSVRWTLMLLAAAAFLVGPRKAYFVFDVAKISVGLMVLVRVGPRYWGGLSWSSSAESKR